MFAISLSFAERLIPRVASAIVMLLLAIYLSPTEVGIYASLLIGLTLVQAISDGAIRQIAVGAVGFPKGERFLRQYTRVASLAGTLVMMGIYGLVVWSSAPADKSQAALLAPVVLVPFAAAIRTRGLALIQSHGDWGLLARLQAVASGASLAISVPTLVLTESLLASALQLVMAEALFTVGVLTRSKRIVPSPAAGEGFGGLREFTHMSLYSLASWAQSQADRILLTWWAGVSRLGLYSFSSSIARAGADALSIATANVTRPYMLRTRDLTTFERALYRSLAVALVTYTLTVAGTYFVLDPLLAPVWDESLQAVPVMALSVFPTVVAWSLTSVLTAHGRVAWATPIKVGGMILAVPIALAAVHSIEAAAWLVVLREILVMAATTIAGGFRVWRAPALAVFLTLGLGAIVVALS